MHGAQRRCHAEVRSQGMRFLLISPCLAWRMREFEHLTHVLCGVLVFRQLQPHFHRSILLRRYCRRLRAGVSRGSMQRKPDVTDTVAQSRGGRWCAKPSGKQSAA